MAIDHGTCSTRPTVVSAPRGGSHPVRSAWMTGALFGVLSVYWPLVDKALPLGLGLLRAYDVAVLVVLGFAFVQVLRLGSVSLRMHVPVPTLLLVALYLIVGVRLMSVAFSPWSEWTLLWSVGRYGEALALVVTALVLPTPFGEGLRGALVISGLAETATGALQLIASHGVQPGVGIASARGVYELQVWFAVTGLMMAAQRSRVRFAWLLGGAGILGVAATMIRTAWMQLIIAIGLGALTLNGQARGRYVRRAVLGAVSLGVGIVILAKTSPYLQYKLQQLTQGTGTIGVRLALWSMGLHAFRAYPFLGIGSGGFARYADIIAGEAGVPVPPQYLDWRLSAHNTVVGILAETGLAGLLAYAMYVLGVIQVVRRLARSANGEGVSPTTAALGPTLASTVILDTVAQSSFGPLTLALLLLAIYDLRRLARR
ncbi:O-antigen ligase family protein [Caldinitratiruptor microaerophilus]|uniref:O-antigen ligase family protein n=1 Tax=Caldinitratiruptor microaerophilus TaxID=671077 RepID=UPI0038737369